MFKKYYLVIHILFFSFTFASAQNNGLGLSLTNRSYTTFEPELSYQHKISKNIFAIARCGYTFSKFTSNEYTLRTGLHYNIFKQSNFVFDIGYEIGFSSRHIDDDIAKKIHNNTFHNLIAGVMYNFNNRWSLKGEFAIGDRSIADLSIINQSIMRLSVIHWF